MTVIERAKAHFSQQQRRIAEVPEWADDDGKPLIIHGKPLTLAEKQKIDAYRDRWGKMDALAYTLILKAEDEQGNKIFTLEDKRALMTTVDPDVLARVIMDLISTPSPEAVSKN